MMITLITRILLLLLFSTALHGLEVKGEFRTWTNTEGNTLHAQLISLEENQVVLYNGSRNYTIPIDQFSKNDQAYLAEIKDSFSYRHLIITNDRLADISSSPNLQDLAERRNKEGLNSKIITIQDLRKDRSLRDYSTLEDKIKAVIQREHQVHDLEYVFFCGDHSIIPGISELPKFLANNPIAKEKNVYATIPSDLHYAATALDQKDATSIVHIGRLPVRTKKQLQTYLKKLFTYEDQAAAPFLSTGFLFTSKEEGIGQNYAAGINRELLKLGVGSEHLLSTHEEKDILLKRFKENRFGFSFAGGHGTHGKFCTMPPEYFQNFDDNDHHIFVLSTLACDSGDFTQDYCIGQDIMSAHDRFGAVAAFINSRPAFGGPYGQNRIQIFEREARFTKQLLRVGEISSYSRKKMANISYSTDQQEFDTWITLLKHNLFGDPAVIWRTK